MNEQSQNLLAVVDQNENFRGYVSQEQITREVLANLFSEV
jgi:F0F1-type ATP synthase delta subunit